MEAAHTVGRPTAPPRFSRGLVLLLRLTGFVLLWWLLATTAAHADEGEDGAQLGALLHETHEGLDRTVSEVASATRLTPLTEPVTEPVDQVLHQVDRVVAEAPVPAPVEPHPAPAPAPAPPPAPASSSPDPDPAPAAPAHRPARAAAEASGPASCPVDCSPAAQSPTEPPDGPAVPDAVEQVASSGFLHPSPPGQSGSAITPDAGPVPGGLGVCSAATGGHDVPLTWAATTSPRTPHAAPLTRPGFAPD